MTKDHKITLTYEELLDLRQVFNRYETVRKVKVAYFIARNLTLTEDLEKDFRTATKITPAITKFEIAKDKLLRLHTVRDANNKLVRTPVIGMPGAWKHELIDDLVYEAALTELQEEHAQAMKDSEEIEEQKKELLEKECEVTCYQMPFTTLPEDEKGEIEIMAADLAVLLKYAIIIDDL